VFKCEICKTNLTTWKNNGVENRQVVDIPPITTEVTEYQADVKDCPCCGTRNVGEFPNVLIPLRTQMNVLESVYDTFLGFAPI